MNIDSVRNTDFRHHDSLVALKISAEAGCHLCKLLWTCLTTQVNAKDVNKQLCTQSNAAEEERAGSVDGSRVVTDTAIWLRGEMHDVGRYDANNLPASKIWVYSGGQDDEKAHFDTNVFGRLSLYAPLGQCALIPVVIVPGVSGGAVILRVV